MVDKICDVFEGCIVNHPEMMLEGQIGWKGRCDFSYIFNECARILLIELKFRLQSLTEEAFFKIVAQVCAKADGSFVVFFSHLTVAASMIQLDPIPRSDAHYKSF